MARKPLSLMSDEEIGILALVLEATDVPTDESDEKVSSFLRLRAKVQWEADCIERKALLDKTALGEGEV